MLSNEETLALMRSVENWLPCAHTVTVVTADACTQTMEQLAPPTDLYTHPIDEKRLIDECVGLALTDPSGSLDRRCMEMARTIHNIPKSAWNLDWTYKTETDSCASSWQDTPRRFAMRPLPRRRHVVTTVEFTK
jgi:hypothetical protein